MHVLEHSVHISRHFNCKKHCQLCLTNFIPCCVFIYFLSALTCPARRSPQNRLPVRPSIVPRARRFESFRPAPVCFVVLSAILRFVLAFKKAARICKHYPNTSRTVFLHTTPRCQEQEDFPHCAVMNERMLSLSHWFDVRLAMRYLELYMNVQMKCLELMRCDFLYIRDDCHSHWNHGIYTSKREKDWDSSVGANGVNWNQMNARGWAVQWWMQLS